MEDMKETAHDFHSIRGSGCLQELPQWAALEGSHMALHREVAEPKALVAPLPAKCQTS